MNPRFPHLLTLLLGLALASAAPAAQQTINIGASANDGTGDGLRTAFGKVNNNDVELYNALATSAGLRAILADETGTGALVFAGGAIGAATATSLNGLTITATTGTITIANAKVLTVNNTVTLTGTDGASLNISNAVVTTGSYSDPAWLTVLAWSKLTATPTTLSGYGITDAQPLDADLTTWASITPGSGVGTFLATASSANLRGALTDETGTGALVFSGGNIGAATAASLNGLTITTTTGTLTIASGKTLTTNDNVTLASDGTGTRTLNVGTGGTLGTAAFTAATAYQPADADLTTWAGITPSADVQTVLSSANYAAFRSSLGLGEAYVSIGATPAVIATNSTSDHEALSVPLGVGTWDVEIVCGVESSAYASAGSKMFWSFNGTATESGVSLLSVQQASEIIIWAAAYDIWPPSYNPSLLSFTSFQQPDKSAIAWCRGRLFVTSPGDLKIYLSQYTAVPDEDVSAAAHSHIHAIKR